MSIRGQKPQSLAVAGFIFLLLALSITAIFGPSRLTGFFVGANWENSTAVTADNTQEYVTAHLVFGEHKPANCIEGIFVEAHGSDIQFSTANETFDDVGFCSEVDVIFGNIIYNESEQNVTSDITYTVYWGKFEKVEETPVAADVQPEVTQALETNETIPVTIVIEPTQPSVAADVKDSVSETLVGSEAQYFPEAKAYAAEISKDQVEQLQDIEGIKVEAQKSFSINLPASVPHINASKVWLMQISGENITGKGVTVCVVDTGIDYNHAALGGCIGTGCKVLGGYDFANDDADPVDDNNHGTHVAGIVASNDSVYRGVAPGASLVAMKSFISSGDATSQTIANGIKWCVDNRTAFNISVISMSFSDGGSYSEADCPEDVLVDPQLSAAHSAGILLVAASGNSYSSSGVSYPACNPNVVAVGATGKDNDIVQGFSNSGDALDMWAPGASIMSTIRNNNFGSLSGTSMAAPHVSGAAALLIQYIRLNEGRTLAPDEISDRLEKRGVNVTDARNGITRPRIDAYSTLLPNIKIESPVNQTYNTSNLHYNITVESSSDIYVTEATVSIDGGVENVLANDSAAHWFNTIINTTSGRHVAAFSVKDNTDETYTSIIRFSADLFAPDITLVSPANNSNISAGQIIHFNITDDVSVAQTLYEFNGTNVTLPAPYAIDTANWSRAQHGIIVFASDDVGNYASQYYVWNTGNTAPIIQTLTTDKIPMKNETAVCGATASDAENDSLTIFYSWLNGTSVLNNSQTLDCNSVGCRKGLVLACRAIPYDGQVNGTTSTLNVTVANTPPAWGSFNIYYSLNASYLLSVNLTATDADNDNLTYSVANLPTGSAINATTGAFTWTPSSSYSGNNTLSFRVSDGTDTTNLNIIVYVNSTGAPHTNHAPVLYAINSQTATVGTKFNFTIDAIDDDVSYYGDVLTFTDNATLFNIAKTSNATAKIEFTPSSAQGGIYSVNITVTDSSQASDSEVFKLTIKKASNISVTGAGTGTGAANATAKANVTAPSQNQAAPAQEQTGQAAGKTPTSYAALLTNKSFANASAIVSLVVVIIVLFLIINFRTYPPKMLKQFYRPRPPMPQQIVRQPIIRQPLQKQGKEVIERKPPPDFGFFR